jgi:hypothetical protein
MSTYISIKHGSVISPGQQLAESTYVIVTLTRLSVRFVFKITVHFFFPPL